MTATTSRKTELLLVIALLLFSMLGAKPALAQTPQSCITFGFSGYSLDVTFDPVGNTTTYDFTVFNMSPVIGTFVNVGQIFLFGLPVPTSTASPPGWEFKNVGPKTFFETTANPWWKTPPSIKPMGQLGVFQYVISGAPVPLTAMVNHVQQVTDATGQVPVGSTWFDCAVLAGTSCISVEKSADPTQGIAGTVITYTFTVENCGQSPLTGVTVIDSLLGDITANFIAANGGSDTLASGASVMFTVNRAIQPADPITLTNVVTACGIGPDQNQVCDSDSATVDVIKPCISIVKTATPPSAVVGGNITYNFTVANCGTVVLNGVTVNDTVLGNLTALFVAANGGSPNLNVGASVVFSTNRAIAGGDPDPLVNVVTACGTSPQLVLVCDQDQAQVDIIPNPPPDQASISGGAFNNIGCTGVLSPTATPLL